MEDYIHIFAKICFKEVRMRQFKKKENDIIIILIYVYDKIYMGSSEYLIDEFK